jgi:hypothetical protein
MAYRGRGRGRGRGKRSDRSQRRPPSPQQQQQQQEGDSNRNHTDQKKLKRPVFTKIGELEPGVNDLNVVAKVVSIDVLVSQEMIDNIESKTLYPLMFHRNGTIIAEAVIGDDTGTVIMNITTPKDLHSVQQALKDANKTIIVRCGRTDVFKGFMRLKIEKPYGTIQLRHDPNTLKLYSEETIRDCLNDNWDVNLSKNMSAQKYKIVYEDEE